MIRYRRVLQNVSAKREKFRYCTVSIPSALMNLFPTENVIIEPLQGGMPGILIRPAKGSEPITEI